MSLWRWLVPLVEILNDAQPYEVTYAVLTPAALSQAALSGILRISQPSYFSWLSSSQVWPGGSAMLYYAVKLQHCRKPDASYWSCGVHLMTQLSLVFATSLRIQLIKSQRRDKETYHYHPPWHEQTNNIVTHNQTWSSLHWRHLPHKRQDPGCPDRALHYKKVINVIPFNKV